MQLTQLDSRSIYHNDHLEDNPKKNKALLLLKIALGIWVFFVLIQFFLFDYSGLTALEKLQFFVLMMIPPFILCTLLAIIQRNQKIDQQSALLKKHLTLINNPTPQGGMLNNSLIQQSNELEKASQEANERISAVITMIDEKIATMHTLSKAVEAEFHNINEHMNKSLRDNLLQISNSTHDSMGELKDIIDIIKTREEAIILLNDQFCNTQNDAAEIMKLRQNEIREQMDSQLESILGHFDNLKNQMNEHQKIMFETLNKENEHNHVKINELLSQHDVRIDKVSSIVHQRQEALLSSFENSNNSMYLRIQTILKELGKNSDQLANRVEARQMQMRELLDYNNTSFTSLFTQYNAEYNKTSQNISEMITHKGEKFTEIIQGELRIFSSTLDEVNTQREATEQRLNEKITLSHEQFYDKLHSQYETTYENITGYFGNHKQWLEELATTIEHSNQNLHKRAYEYQEIFQETVGNASENTETLHKIVQTQLENVITSVDRAATHVRDVTVTFDEACGKLETVNQQSEHILDKVDKSLISNTDTLIQTTDQLKICSEELTTNLRKQTSKITDIANHIHDGQTRAFDALVDNINGRIKYLKDSIYNQTAIITQNLDNSIEKQNDIMNDAMNKNIERMNRASDSFSETLSKSCGEVIVKFNAQSNEVEASVVQLLQRLIKSTHTLDEGIGKIHGAVESTDIRIDVLKNISQNQLGFYEGLLSRIEQNSKHLKQQIQGDQEQLIKAITLTEERAVGAKDNLLKDSSFFLERTEDIAIRFSTIQEKLTQHLQMIGDVSSQAQAHCMQMDEKLRGQVTHLQSAINAHNSTLSTAFSPAMEQMLNVSNTIKDRANIFYEQFNQSIDKVNHASSDLNDKGNQILVIFNSAEDSINNAQSKLLNSAGKMEKVAQNIEQQSSRLESVIQHQTREVEKSAQDFETRIHDLTGSLGRYLNTIRESGDDFTTHFSKTGKEFGITATDIQNNFKTTIEMLTQNSTTFETHLRHLLGGMQQTSTSLKNHTNQIADSDQALITFSETSKKSMNRVIEKLEALGGNFDNVSEKINSNIQRLSSSISNQKTGVIAVSSDLKDIRDDLTRQCREALDITERANKIFKNMPETLTNEGDSLIKQINVIKHETEAMSRQVSNDLSTVNHSQYHDPKNHEQVAETIDIVSTSATQPVQAPLTKTTSMPAQTPSSHHEPHSRSQIPTSPKNSNNTKYREFMNLANRVVQELHQTTSELSRLIMPQEERALSQKAFLAGERNVFTRQFLTRSNQDFMALLAQETPKSEVVRKHLHNYQNKFENLVSNAQQTDPENILPNNFKSSDIGKLYLIFTRISGKTPISFDTVN